MAKTPAWTRKEGKNPRGGLNAKGRASAKAEGMNLKPPQPEGGSRKKSFCARMKGMKAKLTSSETANDPNSRINKSLRKWKCADGGEVTVDNALRMARNMGGGTLYNQLNYALNSPTPANPPQDPGPQQPYYQSLPQTRDIIQQYGTPAPGAPTSTPVRQPMPYADGGEVQQTVEEFKPPHSEQNLGIMSALPIDNSQKLDVGEYQRSMAGEDPNKLLRAADTESTTQFYKNYYEQNPHGKKLTYQETIKYLPYVAMDSPQNVIQATPTQGHSTVIDPEGRVGHPLYVAGTTPEGKNVSLTPGQSMDLANKISRLYSYSNPSATEAGHTLFSPDVQKKLPFGLSSSSIGVNVSSSGTPQAQTVAHETGHAIHNYLGRGEIPLKGVPKQAMNEMLNEAQNRWKSSYKSEPELKTYTIKPQEMFAESIRGYIQDPAYFKGTSPATARWLRGIINTDPRINKLLNLSRIEQNQQVAAKGGAIWNKPRPKSLGKSEPLSPSQKASAKAMAKAAGRPYPNMVDNLRAARKADGGQVEGDVQFAPSDLPVMARQPDVEIENALRMARETQPKKEYAPFSVLPLREDEAGVHFDPYAGLLGAVTRPFRYFKETMSGEKPMDVTSPEAVAAAADLAGVVTLGAGAFERPTGALAAGASRPTAAPPGIGHNLPPYQRLINPAGFYSRAHEVAMTALPEQPRTWQEMRSLMMKQPGMREEEMYWSGLHPEAYDPSHKLTREEIAAQVEKNFPKVSPIVKGAENEMRPMHEQYTVPGGKNYNERVLTHEYMSPRTIEERLLEDPEYIETQTLADKLYRQGRELNKQERSAERDAKIDEINKQLSDVSERQDEIKENYSARFPSYTREKYQHVGHLGDISNPILHTRNSEREIPGRGKVWHQEEVQSDWAQQGREKGLFDVTKASELKSKMKDLSDQGLKIINEFNAKYGDNWRDDPRHAQEYLSRTGVMDDEYNRMANELKSISTGVPSAPHVRDTEHWLDLAAKDTLKSAIEGGHDWIFITGGQEQAKRWSNELKKAVDTIRWEPLPSTVEPLGVPKGWGAAGEVSPNTKVVYAKPTGSDTEQRFVVKPVEQPGGKVRYEVIDSSIPQAKGETLAAVVGQDMAKRIMAEESGEQAMKGYRLGSEGYTQTYERKYPSSFKKLIKQLDPQAKIEAGTITPEGSKIPKAALPTGYVAPHEAVGGTWIQITPKMRAEYELLKKQHGAVFPAYRTGGGVKSLHPDLDVENALRTAKHKR